MMRLLILILLISWNVCGWAADDLQSFPNCTLVDQPWADGDSFSVMFPDGKERTVRLYGADCIEINLKGDNSNAQRLRDQRRYFGIADIQKAKAHGETAREVVAKKLSKPFTIITAFADGRGDKRYQRVYAFVITAEGNDLATELVSKGLARAFGVTRSTPNGTTGKEYMARLHDSELAAAKAGKGAWADTDWAALEENRRQARSEEAEIEEAKGEQPLVGKINLNKASRDELMRLPGIGEKLANRIITARQNRPFAKPEDVLEVNGIGKNNLEKLLPFLEF